MTQAQGRVNDRCECVTRKTVLVLAYYFTTSGLSQFNYGRPNRLAYQVHRLCALNYGLNLLEPGIRFLPPDYRQETKTWDN